MEVASGVIAVVSLRFHLSEVVQKANAFLRGIHNAPDEIPRLSEGLTQLELLLSLANMLVGQHRSLNGLPEFPESINLIANALYKCERSTRELSAVVDKIRMSSEHQRWVRRTWASIKAVLEQEDIERLRKRIHEDQAYLQMAIVINMSHIQLHTIKTNSDDHIKHSISHRSSHSYSLDIAVDDSVTLQDTNPAILGKGQSTIQRERHTLGYRGMFGYVQIRTKVRVLKSVYGSDGTVLSEETSIIARPLFVKRTLEFRFQKSLGGLTRTLRSYPMAPYNSEFFSLCHFGRLEDLQQAISRGQVSPFVTDESGRTLIHHAAMYAHTDICLLLIRLGVDPGQMCSDGNKPMHFLGHLRQYDKPEIKKGVLKCLRLVITATDHVTVDDITRFFDRGYGGPPEGVDLVLSQGISADKIDSGDQATFTPLHNALRNYGNGDKDWISPIKKMLRKRLDIHAPRPAKGMIRGFPGAILTPLDHLLIHKSYPSDEFLVAMGWLSMLEEEGYDVMEYLQEEVALHYGQQMFTTDESQFLPRKLVFHKGDLLAISWDWWTDPLSECSLARNEFKHLNYHCTGYNNGDTVGLLSTWEDLWPFGCPTWSGGFEMHKIVECYQDWVLRHQKIELNQTRFARREKKKQVKLARAQGTYRPNHVPSAWVE